MSDHPTPQDARPVLGSLTLRGAIAMAVAFAAARLGVALPDGALQVAASAIADLVFIIGIAAVGIGRARARGPLA